MVVHEITSLPELDRVMRTQGKLIILGYIAHAGTYMSIQPEY
ncbi:hypothetical protein K3495_g14971 [Podosphaera aphanis]|nr:hypothetical protein K3495_g14971 [Podosphaera aphanis]